MTSDGSDDGRMFDASAAMKLIVDETESDALLAELLSVPSRRLVASWLLHAELHGVAGRHPEAIGGDAVDQVFRAVSLVDVTRR